LRHSGSVRFEGVNARDAQALKSYALDNGYSASSSRAQKSQTDGSRGGASNVGTGARKIIDETGEERLSASNLAWARPLGHLAWGRALSEIQDKSKGIRGLNANEKKMIGAWMNNIDLSVVQIGTLGEEGVKRAAAVTIGNTILFPPDPPEDFTTSKPSDQSTFIHEMVHVWDGQNVSANTWIDAAQAQDNAFLETGKSINAYMYSAQSLRDFKSANPESRAAQVEDYWRRLNGLESAYYSDYSKLSSEAIPNDMIKKPVPIYKLLGAPDNFQ
jgi:hypothetical protein